MGLKPGHVMALGEPVTICPLSHSLTPAETRTSPEPQALAKVPDIHPSPHLAALCPGSPRGLLSTLMGSPWTQSAAILLIKAIATKYQDESRPLVKPYITSFLNS